MSTMIDTTNKDFNIIENNLAIYELDTVMNMIEYVYDIRNNLTETQLLIFVSVLDYHYHQLGIIDKYSLYGYFNITEIYHYEEYDITFKKIRFSVYNNFIKHFKRIPDTNSLYIVLKFKHDLK